MAVPFARRGELLKVQRRSGILRIIPQPAFPPGHFSCWIKPFERYAVANPAIIEARRDQMFPVLGEQDIARLKRFGQARAWPAGGSIVKAGEIVARPGAGAVGQDRGQSGRRVQLGRRRLSSMARASSWASWRNCRTARRWWTPPRSGDVDSIVIPARALRDVMVQEAELGERLMRALILRRVGLLQSGESGPILIGPTGSSDMLRLENFLTRNGHPHQQPGFRHRFLRPRSSP